MATDNPENENKPDDKAPEVVLSPGTQMLRRIVIIGAFVLLFGFVALIIAVIFKFCNKPTPDPKIHYTETQQVRPPMPDRKIPTPQEIIPSLEVPAEKCVFQQNTNLPISGEIVSYTLNNNILTIVTAPKTKHSKDSSESGFLSLNHLKPAGPQQIIIYDLCRGDILSRVNLVEEK